MGTGPRAVSFDFERWFDHSVDALCLVADGRLRRANPSFAAAAGRPAPDLVGGPFIACLHPEDASAMTAALRALPDGAPPGSVEARLACRDGSYRRFSWTLTRDDDTILACGRADAGADGILPRLAHQLPGVIYEYRLFPDGRSCFPFASDAMREIYELAPEDVREDATPVFERLHPDDIAGVRESIMASAASLEDWRYDYRVILPVQGERWRRGQSRPQRLPDGSVVWHGFIADITDLKRIQEALLQKEAAIASALTGIAMADMNGVITYVNRAFVELWGYTDEREAVGRSAATFWGQPEVAASVMEAIRSTGTWSGEMTARRADGVERILQVHATQFSDTLGRPAGMLASFLDVTVARRLQEQFVQAQKMESVGRLAGGVAHDFNNLLTVIQGYVGLILMSLDRADPVRQDVLEVEKAAESAAALTQQLLAFSRKQLVKPVVLDLNQAVTRVQAMLGRLLGEDIVLRTVMAPDLGAVRFDPGQAEQILVNLAVNARDAMPNGGTLTITTANVAADGPTAPGVDGASAGPSVMLAVTDDGVGMSEEVQSHLFEPFFTTKVPGSGTGLGLSMVYGAVRQNGGRIEVVSRTGAGTTFRIYLPRVYAEVAAVPSASADALPGGTERILLVEDDEQVRTLAARLLEQLGYDVWACRDGRDALAVVLQGEQRFDLLVTDVIMPGINGRELADALGRVQPTTGVLFTSGYTANIMMKQGVLPDDVEFLPKPYTVELLARRVRSVLDRQRTRR